jgi:hypothetical protein
MQGRGSVRYRARAAPSAGGLIGLALVVVFAATTVLALLGLLGVTPSTISQQVLWLVFLISGAATVLLVYLVIGYFSIGYDVTGETVRIRWGGRVDEVRIDRLTYAGPAAAVLGSSIPNWQPFWPGYYVGRLRTPLGPVRVVATQPVSRQLLLSTDAGHWAISPAQPVAFLDQLALARRRHDSDIGSVAIAGRDDLAAAGWTAAFPTLSEARQVARGRGLGALVPRLGRDPLSLVLLGLALLLLASQFVFLLVQSSRLPEMLVLHWNAAGLPDRIGTRREVWILPIVATIVVFANVALAVLAASLERFAAWLLLGGTIIVLILVWIALLVITL